MIKIVYVTEIEGESASPNFTPCLCETTLIGGAGGVKMSKHVYAHPTLGYNSIGTQIVVIP